MANKAGEAQRERREWLLRLFSQSQQQQQSARSGARVSPEKAPGTWRPAPGWTGQNAPELLPTFEIE